MSGRREFLQRSAVAGILVLSFAVSARGQGTDQHRVGLDGKDWSVLMEFPGFKVSQNGARPDGRRYFMASNSQTGVNISLTLERVKEPATGDGCKSHLKRIAEQQGSMGSDIEFSESPGYQHVAFTINEVQGIKLNQRFFRACAAREDVYVDFNFSKVQFEPRETSLFTAILANVRFDNSPELKRETSSLDLWMQGGQQFRARNYKAAIEPYSRALAMEKQRRQLPDPYWYVLIDNLGMAYGISGNLEKAMETFDYGVSQDPNYPLFYYNLACTYAEMNDKGKAIEYLQKAFEKKDNVLPGERMPDPTTDDSFQRFMKDREFRDLVEQLAKSAK